MEIWGWIVLYAVGLTLLQLLVYRFLLSGKGSPTRRRTVLSGDPSSEEHTSAPPSREQWRDQQPPNRGRRDGNDGPWTSDDGASNDGASNDGAGPSSEGVGWSSSRGTSGPRRVDTANGRYCQHCGAENESDTVFDRCWNCAGRL